MKKVGLSTQNKVSYGSLGILSFGKFSCCNDLSKDERASLELKVVQMLLSLPSQQVLYTKTMTRFKDSGREHLSGYPKHSRKAGIGVAP